MQILPALLAATTALVFLLGLRYVAHARKRRRASALEIAESTLHARDELLVCAGGEYFSNHQLCQFETRFASLLAGPLPASSLALITKELREAYLKAWNALVDRHAFRNTYNTQFVAKRSAELAPWFSKEHRTFLTEGQLRAIATDEDSTLVVAAAGSGKSTTIVAKIQYLVARGLARPAEICVLAFNRDAARTVQERLEARGIVGVRSTTFHALGYAITGEAAGHKPPVSPLVEESEMSRFMMDLWRRLILATDGYRDLLILWFTQMRVTLDMLAGCASRHESIQLERALDLRTLTEVRVKSQAEVKVADWLTLHGIAWEYERPYALEERAPDRRAYQPDFFLPEHDLWLEVWGVKRDGSGGGPIDVIQYRAQMQWKRDQHAKHGTTLIEVYQDDIWADDFQARMESLLTNRGARVRRLSNEELHQLLAARRGPASSRLLDLLRTFLSLQRGGCWSLADIESRARNERDRSFLRLYSPFLNEYQESLRSRGEIDFDAMLGDSLAHLPRTTSFRFKYVFVDEFQDTSRSRLALASGLRDAVDGARLFLVGDDWQSINRFAGSDLGIFVDAEEFVGPLARVDLDVTFRLPEDALRISSEFITQNPRQLKKSLQPYHQQSAQGNIVLVPHSSTTQLVALERVLEKITSAPNEGKEVLLLARYNWEITEPAVRRLVERYARSGWQIECRTIHRAKGLEARHVVVLGLTSGSPGFPSTVLGDPVLQLVSSAPDDYPFAEERRLMYVALTRSLGRTYLLFPEDTPSPFIEELISRNHGLVDGDGEIARTLTCPVCSGDTIRRRDGKYGAFWACLNFPQCEGRLATCPHCAVGALVAVAQNTLHCSECGSPAERCPRCGQGALIRRKSAKGQFWGCSNWRQDASGCGYTRNIKDDS